MYHPMDKMTKPTPTSSLADKELQRLETQFEEHKEQINSLTLDRMNEAPKLDVEPQTKLSSNELADLKNIYLKPVRIIGSREKFNERFREDYNFKKEYVPFIAENKEVIGEHIEVWTKPFPGCPAEFWNVPVNKPVYGPRYLAEQIRGCSYHRLSMDESKVIGQRGEGQYYGSMVVDNVVQRLTADPYTKSRSVFTGVSF